MEFTQKLGAAASAVALSIGGIARAQDAVQWRVEDGGNGHWYARNNASLTWEQAIASAQSRGGALATTTSSAELAFIGVHLISDGMFCWLGGTIDCAGATGPCCDNCAWRWTSGEPFDVSWTGWIGDNDYTTERLVTNGVGFDDMCSPCVVIDYRPPSIIEWSADCNNDGIVDFGQIRAGELEDANGNNVPDDCEKGGGDPYGPQEWPKGSGGNGHWYQVATPGALTWTTARALAEDRGGQLACAESITEKQFIMTRFGFQSIPNACTPENGNPATQYGPWIGGYQEPGSAEPLGGWRWLTGNYFDPAEAECCNNSGCAGAEDRLHLYWRTDIGQTWNDAPNQPWPCSSPISYLIEWSADCNNDGIVDFGQIRTGELEDANGNNVPDCCEGSPSCNCPADIARDGAVNGIDLAAVLNNWGSPGGTFNADINNDGLVDGADLAEVLNSWGPCP